MDRFLLTLLVTVEQEYAIQKLFGRHGWLYSRIVGEKCSTKSPIASIQMPSETQLLTSTECCLPENTHVKVEDSQTELDDENTNIDTASEQLTCDGTDLDIKYEIVDDENKGVGNDDHVDTRTDKSLENQGVEDGKDSTDGSKPFGQHGDDTIENPFDPVNNKTHSRTFISSDGANLLGIGKRTLETKVEAESSKIRKTEESTDHLSNERSDYGVERNEFDVKAEVLTDKEEEELSDSLSDSEKIVTVSDKNDAETSLSHMRNIKDLQNKTNISLYYCNVCHYTFTEEKYFNSHKKNGKCVFTCQFCKKEFTFKRFRAYKEHLKQHREKLNYADGSSNRHYVCPICTKTNSSVFNMARHVDTIHTIKTNAYRCQQCHLTFTTKQMLLSHRKSHQCICSICGKMYASSSSLKVHMQNTHSDEKLYCSVEYCSYVTNSKQALDFHLNKHSGDKPYTCKHCGNSYRRKDSCSRHQLVCVNGVSCDKCTAKFGSKNALSAHVRAKHSNDRFQCLCGSVFRYRANLLRHGKTTGHAVTDKECEHEAEFIAVKIQ